MNNKLNSKELLLHYKGFINSFIIESQQRRCLEIIESKKGRAKFQLDMNAGADNPLTPTEKLIQEASMMRMGIFRDKMLPFIKEDSVQKGHRTWHLDPRDIHFVNYAQQQLANVLGIEHINENLPAEGLPAYFERETTATDNRKEFDKYYTVPMLLQKIMEMKESDNAFYDLKSLLAQDIDTSTATIEDKNKTYESIMFGKPDNDAEAEDMWNSIEPSAKKAALLNNSLAGIKTKHHNLALMMRLLENAGIVVSKKN